MNAKLRDRAESLLICQEVCGYTDSKTLNAAIIMAHHDKKFQRASQPWSEYWDWAAQAMREKFPKCPCRACKRSRNEPES